MTGPCTDNAIIDYFPIKVPNDLQNCEVKMLACEIPPYVIDINEINDPRKAGIEVKTIHTVAERMKFNAVYSKEKYSHWGFKYPNGTYTYMVKRLKEKHVDIIYGMATGNDSLIYEFDCTIFHLIDAITWFVPVASQIPHWKHITMIFKFMVWLFILSLFIVSICIIFLF